MNAYPQISRVESCINLQQLSALFPFDRLEQKFLIMCQAQFRRVSVRRGEYLLQLGDDDGFDYYLREGKVLFEAEDGQRFVVEAGDERAALPLIRLKPSRYKVRAIRGAASFFKVPAMLIDTFSRHRLPLDAYLQQSELCHLEEVIAALYLDLDSERLVLPSLAANIAALQHGLQRRSNLTETMLRADPAINLKLQRITNSVLFSQSIAWNLAQLHEVLGESMLNDLLNYYIAYEVLPDGVSNTLLKWCVSFYPRVASRNGLAYQVGAMALCGKWQHLSPQLIHCERQQVCEELRLFGAYALQAWSIDGDSI